MPYRLLVRAASRATGRLGWLRGATGAALGIALAGLATHWLLDPPAGTLWLAGPLGASAVLVYVLPASPLAQPWPVAGGSMVSLAIGLVVAALVPQAWLAAALAVGLAIALMALLRCIHPPGGACALLGVLAGPTASAHPVSELAVPLGLNLALLLAGGWVWNNLTGHRWPHEGTQISAPQRGEGVARYDEADLDSVLEEWEEVLDVSRDDLDALFRAVERRAESRRRGRGA